MRRCSAWMKRPQSRRSTARIRCCRCRQDAPSAMASSTSGTARCRCMPRSTPRLEKYWGARHNAIPRPSLSPSLTDIVANQPKGKEIHVIADNLSAHKTKRVEQFLAEHTNVHMHFTPTYSSWLNQVELWFAKIERDVIARGVFTSVADLKRKLMRYIRQYNKQPKRVKWKYFDTARRITPESIVTAH